MREPESFLDIIFNSVCAAVFFNSKNVSDVEAEVELIRTAPAAVIRSFSDVVPLSLTSNLRYPLLASTLLPKIAA